MHRLFSRRGFLQMALAASGGLFGWAGPLRKSRSATIGTTQGCDELSRITTMRDSTAQVTKHFYDAQGRIIKTIVYGGSVTA